MVISQGMPMYVNELIFAIWTAFGDFLRKQAVGKKIRNTSVYAKEIHGKKFFRIILFMAGFVYKQ